MPECGCTQRKYLGAHFLWERIAPLQHRSQPLWRLKDAAHSARLHVDLLSNDSMVKLSQKIFSKGRQAMVDGILALFDAPVAPMDKLVNASPDYDRWGIKPPGCTGERENPFVPEATEELAPGKDASGEESGVLPRADSSTARRSRTMTPTPGLMLMNWGMPIHIGWPRM